MIKHWGPTQILDGFKTALGRGIRCAVLILILRALRTFVFFVMGFIRRIGQFELGRIRVYMLVGAAVVLCGARDGAAVPIDYDLTAGGGDMPFAERREVVPTLWELFSNRSLSLATDRSLTVFDTNQPADLAGQFGQIVKYGQPSGADRAIWLVYDRWAAVASPQILYFDPGTVASSLIADDRPPTHSTPTLAGPAGFDPDGSSPRGRRLTAPVPEPAASVVLLVLLAARPPRRR